MTETKHTLTPYSLPYQIGDMREDFHADMKTIHVVDAHGTFIVHFNTMYLAEQYVRACNAHDELLEVAKFADRLVKLIEDWVNAEQEENYAIMDIVALAQHERRPEKAIAMALAQP